MYNKDDLLDSYFMTNDYKETDIETVTKSVNKFIKDYGFDDIEITRYDECHIFIRIMIF